MLGIDPQASTRCARAHPLAGGVFAALRDALAALTSEQMAEVAELTAKLAAVGVTPSGAHIGMWLMGLAPSLDATRPTGVILDPQPPPGMATAVSACHAEAVRRVAEVADLSDATKATMVTALSAQLAESFMGESLTGEASGEEVAQFATSVLTANIKTMLVVKLLGARKDTKTNMGGRTVMSGARFGSMTGARHDRATRTHGSPRRQCMRTPPTHDHGARAHMAAEGADACGGGAAAAACTRAAKRRV